MKYLLIMFILFVGCATDHLITVKNEYRQCYVSELNVNEKTQEIGVWCNKCGAKAEHTIIRGSAGSPLLAAKAANRSCFVYVYDQDGGRYELNMICSEEVLQQCFSSPPSLTIIYSNGKRVLKARPSGGVK